ncbi:MAG: hypothetical protein M1828_000980 [Chrysothrix sp. TS-e1954]|nr:MAG: hypothetical protein M1828_000980 [Chrysothrix sp. TS-e1954]
MASDLASTLTPEEVPVKLRCASCNKLVQEAFRLPCCDQNICGSCHSTLPSSCPICDHEPLVAADCKQNKNLRLTVRAYLKSEEKKRDKVKQAEAPTPAPKPATPLPVTPIVAESAAAASPVKGQADTQQDGNQTRDVPKLENVLPSEIVNEEQNKTGDVKQSVERSVSDGQSHVNEEHAQEDSKPDGSERSLDSADIKVDDGTQKDDHNPQSQMANNNFGFNGMMNGFANQNWPNNNFNPMMAMQNGMPGGFNAFPNMMGMPMAMNPQMMMSQGMFGGFNGQGMGMNGMSGMNMGMGFNNGGNAAAFGGWDNDGSASQMNGMMNGNGADGGYGGSNAGSYYPGDGYNQRHAHGQGNFHHQQFANHNYQRFRGRGPSFRGRGRGFGHFGPGPAANREYGQAGAYQQYANQRSQDVPFDAPSGPKSLSGQGSVNGDAASTSRIDEDGKEIVMNAQQKDVDNTASPNNGVPTTDATNTTNVTTEAIEKGVDGDQGNQEIGTTGSQDVGTSAAAPEQASDEPQPIATLETLEASYHDDDYNNYQDPTLAPDHVQVPNAPLGPAAQFQSASDYPYPPGGGRGYSRGFGRGFYRGRGRGSFRGGFVGPPVPAPVVEAPEGAPTGPKALREGPPVRGRGGFIRGGPSVMNGRSAVVPQLVQQSSSVGERRERSPQRDSEEPRQRRKSPDYGPDSRREKQREDTPPAEEEFKRPHRPSRRESYDERNGHPEDAESAPQPAPEEGDTPHRHRSSRHDYPEEGSAHRSSRRERSRDRDRDRDRERDKAKDRDRDRERRKHRHRSRSRSHSPANDHDHTDDDHHASRRSKHTSSSSRRHHHRSRSRSPTPPSSGRDRDRDPYREKDRDRDRDRHRDRDRDSHRTHPPHRPSSLDLKIPTGPSQAPKISSAVSLSVSTPIAPSSASAQKPPREFKIKGTHSSQTLYTAPRGPRSDRDRDRDRDRDLDARTPNGPRASRPADNSHSQSHYHDSKPATTRPAQPLDPHALERSKRDRERMLKEAQRRSISTQPQSHTQIPTGPSALLKRKASSFASSYGDGSGSGSRGGGGGEAGGYSSRSYGGAGESAKRARMSDGSRGSRRFGFDGVDEGEAAGAGGEEDLDVASDGGGW